MGPGERQLGGKQPANGRQERQRRAELKGPLWPFLSSFLLSVKSLAGRGVGRCFLSSKKKTKKKTKTLPCVFLEGW